MASFGAKMLILGFVVLLLVSVEGTPPGLAKEPKRVKCNNTKYKYCNNLEHVCPKFCPDSCTVECVSCRPICGSGETETTPSTPPATVPLPSPPTPSPSPPTPTPSPPTPTTTPSPSPPTPTTTPSPSPPTPTPSPPTPTTTPSPLPPSLTPSPPSPTTTPSPSPPTPTTTPSPSPPTPNTTPTTPTPSSPSPSPPSSSPPPQFTPPSSASGQKRVRCKNKNYTCYGQEHVCPADCPTTCEVDCVTCKPVCRCDYPGSVCQDPRFIGGDGITFYFHGKKDKNFCLITDPNLHINGHFIGKRSPNMTRDFTWVQSLGILFETHRLFVGAERTAKWSDSVDRLALSYDDEPIFLPQTEGATWHSPTSPKLTLTRTTSNTNKVVIELEGRLKITAKAVPITEKDSEVHSYGITRDDCFAHLDLGFKFYSLTGDVEGVLGKTYREDYVSKVNVGVKMPVLGGEDEYETSGLFASDCKVSRFHGLKRELGLFERLLSY